MKPSAFVLVAAFTLGTVTGWWDQAVQSYGRSDSYYPASLTIRVEEYSKDNKLESVEWGEIRQQWVQGKLVSTVVKAEKDGKNVTEAWQKRYDKQNEGQEEKNSGAPDGYDVTPFEEKYRGDLVLDDKNIVSADGQIAVPYEVRGKKSKASGVVFFTPQGIPVRAVQSYLTLPPFVKTLKAEFSYAVVDNTLVMSSLVMNTAVNAVLLVKNYRIQMSFRDWKPKL